MTHELLHGSLLRSRRLCGWFGILTGLPCNISPSVWVFEHSYHHKHSNNLDKRQDGQGASWTLERFESAPLWQKWIYFFLNNRLIFFTIAPIGYFFGFMRIRAQLHENMLASAFFYLLYRFDMLGLHLLSFWFTAAFGFMVFHAQHVFDGIYRRRLEDWDSFENAILGSSLLVRVIWNPTLNG